MITGIIRLNSVVGSVGSGPAASSATAYTPAGKFLGRTAYFLKSSILFYVTRGRFSSLCISSRLLAGSEHGCYVRTRMTLLGRGRPVHLNCLRRSLESPPPFLSLKRLLEFLPHFSKLYVLESPPESGSHPFLLELLQTVKSKSIYW